MCHEGSHQRQREPKDHPLARRALDPDATALRFYQALRDGQAEAAVEMMERLAEVLADESDGSVRAVARALARRVARVARQHGAWPNQRAAISALVLHGASPREARSAARAAFRA